MYRLRPDLIDASLLHPVHLLVVDLPVGPVPAKVLVSLLDHGDDDNEDERRDGRERRDGAVDEQLDHAHDKEVEVGDAPELFEKVSGNEKLFLKEIYED